MLSERVHNQLKPVCLEHFPVAQWTISDYGFKKIQVQLLAALVSLRPPYEGENTLYGHVDTG